MKRDSKDLAHILRLLGVDSYEEALVVLAGLTGEGRIPVAPLDVLPSRDGGAQKTESDD